MSKSSTLTTAAVLARIHASTARVAAFLQQHPAIGEVYWAHSPASRANYDRLARTPNATGGMITFTLKKLGALENFYDRLNLPKGPSFGMKTTLICPFMYLAHYDLVTTPAGQGSGSLRRNQTIREPLDCEQACIRPLSQQPARQFALCEQQTLSESFCGRRKPSLRIAFSFILLPFRWRECLQRRRGIAAVVQSARFREPRRGRIPWRRPKGRRGRKRRPGPRRKFPKNFPSFSLNLKK